MTDLKEELLQVILTGSPIETKLAFEQLTEILRNEMPPPPPEVKGELIETYKAGDYTASVYSSHGKFFTHSVSNPSAKLMHQRGQGIISQPEFAQRINKVPMGDITTEGKINTHSATLLIKHKNGSATTRKVTHRRNWSDVQNVQELLAYNIITKEDAQQRLATIHQQGYCYRDCRSNVSLSREHFLESFPQPLHHLAPEITFHLEVEALPPFAR